ncbi:unnamed protein product [Orchesella dallaii]|uniref:Potassium channel domain-containing protein n=1 Tax=Orchesella dallaii TaxID=48710 RepID=A0ABP1QT10_9HEXA
MATLPVTNPDVPPTRQPGLCQFLNMKEENIRFILLAVLLFVYLAVGAFLFQAVEESAEKKIREDFATLYDQFVRNLTGLHSITFGFDTADESGSGNDFSVSPNGILGGGNTARDVVSENGSSSIYGSSSANSSGADSYLYGQSYAADNINTNKSTLSDSWNSNNIHSSSSVSDKSTSSLGRAERFYARQPPSIDNLHELLFAYGNATQAGVIWKRRRWDYVGSFHFTWTIVSTIGYGATTPTTTLGKLFVIPYGFFGCAGGLLFFNLFLERIITFLASCMRTYRLQRQKRRPFIYGGGGETGVWGGKNTNRGASPAHSSTGEGSAIDEPDWKPSVYWVMLCLFIMSAIVIFGSAYMFQQMEGWTFWDGVYFSFVSYATIGFGDFVSLQEKLYGSFEILYRLLAFIIMIFGCCCIYSLLNVTSIVIKQLLNWVIQKIHYCGCCRCCCVYCQCSAATMRRKFSTKKRRNPRRKQRDNTSQMNRSNFQIAVLKVGSHAQNVKTFRGSSTDQDDQIKEDSPDGTPRTGGYRGNTSGPGGTYFDLDERRCSGENMISIRGELSNKVSLAVMQKRLYETAQMSRNIGAYDSSFSATSVGPLAIVTEKLGDNHG